MGSRISSFRRRGDLRREGGQVVALLAVSAAALIAMGAFVIDVGSWFRVHRAAQATADAAALAGAQALPTDPGRAGALALEYAGKNGGGVGGGDIRFESFALSSDTIRVTARAQAPGFLSRVLGISSVNVSADAAARAYNLQSGRYVAPFGVDVNEPFVRGDSSCPCFGDGYTTTIPLDTATPSLGAFKVLNLDGSRGGVGATTLGEWIMSGYDGDMDLGWYYSDPGAKFNPAAVQSALEARVGSDLLLPVYDAVQQQGADYQYRVIGWIGFHLESYETRGGQGTLTGYFTDVAWEGIPATSGGGGQFFGAVVVKLVG